MNTTSTSTNILIDRLVADEPTREQLISDAVAWCSQHGLVYGAGLKDLPVAIVPAPISLLPVAYPRDTFVLAKQAATVFNSLIDAVARDDDYLHTVLQPAAKYDDFTRQLLEVHATTKEARKSRINTGKDFLLAINRSDYMLHGPTSSLLQVELNTIASSFGCLSTLVGRLHRYLFERSLSESESMLKSELERLPSNDAMGEIADALALAVAADGTPHGVMVMVVQPGERNAFDQQWLQLTLWEKYKVKTIRKTLGEIGERGNLDEEGRLIIDGNAASVVYFRAGYTPNDYMTAKEWEARVLIEQSNAIACPTVALQLAGAKKVQQDLANPGVLERFVEKPGDAKLLREFFAGLWGLDDLDADTAAAAAVVDAIKNPGDYVLKPQREGGGNNLYGEAMKVALEGKKGLGDKILMQRILPPVNSSIMVRLGEGVEVETLSELGIYGTYLRRGDEVLLNKEAGHLVRTKAATSDEGGVAAGFAVLDSPYLV